MGHPVEASLVAYLAALGRVVAYREASSPVAFRVDRDPVAPSAGAALEDRVAWDQATLEGSEDPPVVGAVQEKAVPLRPPKFESRHVFFGNSVDGSCSS